MSDIDASESLREAERLSSRMRRSTLWYARYLLLFAVGSLGMAIGYAALGPKLGSWILTPIWLLFVLGISLYANRQRTQLRGLNRLNSLMIAAWAVAWTVTVFGSFQFDQAVWWWLLGGAVMAVPPMVVRRMVLKRVGAS